MSRIVGLSLSLALVWLAALPLAAQEAATPATPATHTVKKAPLRIEVTLSGVFEAQQMTPVLLRPEAWTTLSVLEAVEHGAQVKQGDVLVRLDPEGLDASIAESEAGQRLAELGIQQSQEELRAMETSLPADLAAAEHAKQTADEDLQRFLDKHRPLSVRVAEFSLKNAADSLEYQQEELRQLERMYKADDLTEETEEIILKRARNDVESANFYLERTRSETEQSLQIDLPRLERQYREAARRMTLELEKARVTLPVTVSKARVALDKLRHDHQQADERLAKLKRDRELLVVKAPVDGVVYYGSCHRGKWSSTETKFARGASLTASAVFMTIVSPRPMLARVAAAEKDLQHLRAGVKGRAVAVALPQYALAAEVTSVASVPTADATYDTQLTIQAPDAVAPVMPGMNCTITLLAYNQPAALTVPATAVFADDADPARQIVFRLGQDGAWQSTPVELGRRTDDKVEVLQGLLEGDAILLSNPLAGP